MLKTPGITPSLPQLVVGARLPSVWRLLMAHPFYQKESSPCSREVVQADFLSSFTFPTLETPAGALEACILPGICVTLPRSLWQMC